MDVLLVHPWTVALGPAVGVPIENGAEPVIANPVSFIAQKLLIQKSRPPPKRPQDALYVHDTLELFGDSVESLAGLWRDTVRPSLQEGVARRVEELSARYAADASAIFAAAARIPQDRRLDPGRMQQVCAYGLNEIFRPAGDH